MPPQDGKPDLGAAPSPQNTEPNSSPTLEDIPTLTDTVTGSSTGETSAVEATSAGKQSENESASLESEESDSKNIDTAHTHPHQTHKEKDSMKLEPMREHAVGVSINDLEVDGKVDSPRSASSSEDTFNPHAGGTSVIRQPSNIHQSEHNSSAPVSEQNPIPVDRRYYQLTSIISPVICFSLLAIEGLVLGLAHYITAKSPINIALDATTNIANAGVAYMKVSGVTSTGVQAGNSTTGINPAASIKALAALMQEAKNFNAAGVQAKDAGDTLWKMQMVVFGLHLALLMSVAIVTFVNRDHPTVRSQGRQYLACAFTFALIHAISEICATATFNLQLATFPDATQLTTATVNIRDMFTDLNDMLFAFTTVAFFSLSFFLGAICMRARVIYHVFNRTFKANQITYIGPIWVNFIVGCLCQTPPTIRKIFFEKNDFDRHKPWSIMGVWFIVFFYTVWFGYYTYKSQNCNLRFADRRSNMRIILAVDVVAVSLLTYSHVYPMSVITTTAGWSAASRFILNYYALEQLTCQLVQIKYKPPPLTNRSVSVPAVAAIRGAVVV